MVNSLVKFSYWLTCAALMFSIVGCQKNTNDDLIRAAETGNLADVSRLLSKGADANAMDRNGYPALYFAAYKGHKDVVVQLIGKGADINAKGNTGYTPLHGAAMGGHKEIAELLLEKGADVNARSVHGMTPLREARNNVVAELLRQYGGN